MEVGPYCSPDRGVGEGLLGGPCPGLSQQHHQDCESEHAAFRSEPGTSMTGAARHTPSLIFSRQLNYDRSFTLSLSHNHPESRPRWRTPSTGFRLTLTPGLP